MGNPDNIYSVHKINISEKFMMHVAGGRGAGEEGGGGGGGGGGVLYSPLAPLRGALH